MFKCRCFNGPINSCGLYMNCSAEVELHPFTVPCEWMFWSIWDNMMD